MNQTTNTRVAYFGAGCFWQTEEAYRKKDGVVATAVGFMGGNVTDPTYNQVCNQDTGHAETAKVVYDPQVISYEDLLEIFWDIHDPTQLNRQGPDVGEQYRSVIFYVDESQRQTAEESKRVHESNYNDDIVTEITPAGEFYKAEEYHQKYIKKGN